MVERRSSMPKEAVKSNERVFKTPKNYNIRILSGQFDLSIPFNQALAAEKIKENNPVEAYSVMHRKWDEVRHNAWDNKSGTIQEKIHIWADTASANVEKVFKSENASEDLLKGLNTIGLAIQNPSRIDKEEIKNFFADNFYNNFAGNEEKSIGNLAEKFFNIYLNEPTEDSTKMIMLQIKGIKNVLSPILTKEIYERFVEVMEARLKAAADNLSTKDGKRSLAIRWQDAIRFYSDFQNDNSIIENQLPQVTHLAAQSERTKSAKSKSKVEDEQVLFPPPSE